MNNDNIRDVVNDVLREDVRARDSDTWLILQVLRKLGIKIFIDYSQLPDMPSFETITRCRRFIQNTEGLYLPSQDVQEYREIKETNYRKGGIWNNSQLS